MTGILIIRDILCISSKKLYTYVPQILYMYSRSIILHFQKAHAFYSSTLDVREAFCECIQFVSYRYIVCLRANKLAHKP